MSPKQKPPLEPIVKGISTRKGHRYDQCRATVELEVSDGNGGRRDMTVEYPMQDERHLAALMKEKVPTEQGGMNYKNINHTDMQELSSAIKEVVDKERG